MGFPGVVFQEYIPLPGISRSSGHPEYISCIVNIAPLTIVTTYRWKQRYQLIKAKYVEPLVRSFLLSWSFTICLNANPGERLFGILVEWYKNFFFVARVLVFPWFVYMVDLTRAETYSSMDKLVHNTAQNHGPSIP